jgi:hypothetical protein
MTETNCGGEKIEQSPLPWIERLGLMIMTSSFNNELQEIFVK